MLSLLAAILLTFAFGLMGMGSTWCIVVLCSALGLLYLSDSFEWDIEVLGGMMILLMITGFAYAIVRTAWTNLITPLYSSFQL